jgi:hypothetical protein
MEQLLNKLGDLKKGKKTWDNWTLKEKLDLLKIYYIITKKEASIFDLVYDNHGCDNWEDIFRDYNLYYLEEKAAGVQEAIENMEDEIEEKNAEGK